MALKLLGVFSFYLLNISFKIVFPIRKVLEVFYYLLD